MSRFKLGFVNKEASCLFISCAIVTGGETVWDVSVFRYILQQYSASEVLVAKQVMMVETAPVTSVHTLVEAQYLLTRQ